MSTSVPSLRNFLAKIPKFHKAKGKRYSHLTLLQYVCVAMLGGRFSLAAMAALGLMNLIQLWMLCIFAILS